MGHSSIPPYSEAVLHCSVRTTGGRAPPSSGLLEGLTLFAEDTGLIVSRTMVDPSKWKVPVLVSNFSQETIVVNSFTEVGMITQVTAIQSVADNTIQPQGATRTLPRHLQDLIDQTCDDLDSAQRLRRFCRNIQIYFLYREPLSPVTRMRWNTTSIRATGHPSGVHHSACHPRR